MALVKNWLDRKGLQYLETLTTAEKEKYNSLEGLFETLSNKFKPQYNKTVKSLQFRKLYHYADENVEEWMGRLHVAVVECNYQKVDRQLKEQFIHGLNDKLLLEEIIKELTATNNDDHITSGGVLAWAKRVEAQKVQAAVLNTLKESRQFNKIKVSKRQRKTLLECQLAGCCSDSHVSIMAEYTCQDNALNMERHVWGGGKTGHFKKVCCSKSSRAVNELQLEISQEYSKDEIETVSIDSVHMNKNWSLLMAELEMCAGNNIVTIL